MRQIGGNKLVDHSSMHHLGPALLQRPLNVDLSKRCGPECYYMWLNFI